MSKYLIKSALALVVCFAFVTNAEGSLLLILSDGTTTKTIIDEMGSGSTSTGGTLSNEADAFAGVGVIQFSGAIGAFGVNVTTGLSKPVTGGNVIDLNSVNVSGGSGTLTIALIDTDFISNGYGFRTLLGGTTDGTVDLTSFVDAGNSEAFGLVSSSSLGNTGAFSFTGYGPNISGGGNYSMGVLATITHSGGFDVTSFDANFAQVPEPTTVIIWSVLAMGGLGLIGVNRRRRRNS